MDKNQIILGLSTGLAIQKRLPSAIVDIFSEKLSPDTTADGAAGIFGLFLLGKTTSVEKQVEQSSNYEHHTKVKC